jgi:HAE1 family hydrophobic/amphiphilic exporter-1
MNTLSTLVEVIMRLALLNTELVQSNCSSVSRYRALPEDILKLYVKNDRDEMVPYSAFMKLEKSIWTIGDY